MKFPKKTKRYCPYCRKHTEHAMAQVKYSGRSSKHPLSRGGTSRIKRRGERRGYGNLGKYSKPTKPKRLGAKTSKKITIKYTCTICKKKHQTTQRRAKRVEFKAKEK